MAFKIFVSYSTRDLPTVAALKRHLALVGVEVYVAEY